MPRWDCLAAQGLRNPLPLLPIDPEPPGMSPSSLPNTGGAIDEKLISVSIDLDTGPFKSRALIPIVVVCVDLNKEK